MINIKKLWATAFSRPYIEIISESHSAENGWELDLDWNDIFITKLAAAGIEGDEEADMVRTWLSSLMSAQDIEKYDDALMDLAESEQKSHSDEQEFD